MNAPRTLTTRRLALCASALAGLACALQPAWAADKAAFELITADDLRREAAAPVPPPAPPRTRAVPAPAAPAPTIQIIAPRSGGRPAISPLRIEVGFKAPPDARIVPASFRLLYGLLKIDLTERLAAHATIRESGVVVDQAQVPEGTHRLFVRVADDKGRIAEEALLIRIEPRR